MPTYQYACTEPSCGHRFELVQSFSDPAVTECPVCSNRVRKVYGSVGVVFKGSGFYRTDSRAANGASSGSSNGSSSNGSSSSGSSSNGSKSESSSSSSSSDSFSSGTATPAKAGSAA